MPPSVAAEVGVEGEPAHHGAAVDEADVVGARGVVEGELEALLAQEHLVLVDEVDGRGHHVEALPGGVSDLFHGRAAVEQLDRGAALGGGAVVEAEEVGGRRLRVEVDEQGPKALAAKMAARLTAVVVLPTPPFWFVIAMILAMISPKLFRLPVLFEHLHNPRALVFIHREARNQFAHRGIRARAGKIV